LRIIAGLTAMAEIVVFVLVAHWIGLGLTILATLATSALGWMLLARQGMRALGELRERARMRQSAGRELGDAGLVALGGLLMVLPGFLSDVIGLLCLLPGTRGLIRVLVGRVVTSRLPVSMRGPVRVRSARTAPVNGTPHDGSSSYSSSAASRGVPLVIEGEVLRPPSPS
jgi:UPF0716 protein FxsA